MIGKRKAYVVNVSDGGFGLHLDQSIPVGISVRVVLDNHTYLGTIKYCRSVGRVFHVGMSVSGSTKNVRRKPKETAAEPVRA